MRRYQPLIMSVILGFSAIAMLVPSRAAFAQALDRDSSNTRSEEIPRDFVPQNAPCADQPRSLKELKASFKKGRRPLASEMTGKWVAISDLSDPPGEVLSLNCSGERRGSVFEFVLVANGYLIEPHAVGMLDLDPVTMKPDKDGGVEFPEIDFGGEHGPLGNYHCRLTNRDTLACLIGIVGTEFKRMSVEKSQIYVPPDGL